ncbi:MAG: twin-arginine translocation signal domain-containing protein [Candidatus Magasanikbacteria bacterium]|nr:twin-arginine translocation signal domain-containing protein [Candidatus Magasanikbacteria bacterium]
MTEGGSSRRNFLKLLAAGAATIGLEHLASAVPRHGRRGLQLHETRPQPQIQSPEDKELPVGAFGLDHKGYPYGLKFRYQYVPEGTEPEIPLGEPIPARMRSGATKIKNDNGIMVEYTVQLEEHATVAWSQARELFASAVAQDSSLGEITDDLYPTDAFRSIEQQQARRQKLGVLAMLPGRSSHEIGRAIDVYKLNRISMYKWATGFDYKTKKFPPADFIPPLVQLGIIPTEPAEPWHWEFIGSTPEKLAEAAAYWRRYGREIMSAHSKSLWADDK